MNKGYIVLVFPDNCRHCQFWQIENGVFGCSLKREFRETESNSVTRPKWCPIREMPEIMAEPEDGDIELSSYAEGRNDILNEMFGGEV